MNLIFHRLVPGTPRPRFDAAKSERAGLEMDSGYRVYEPVAGSEIISGEVLLMFVLT
jgi:hypothetical protein